MDLHDLDRLRRVDRSGAGVRHRHHVVNQEVVPGAVACQRPTAEDPFAPRGDGEAFGHADRGLQGKGHRSA